MKPEHIAPPPKKGAVFNGFEIAEFDLSVTASLPVETELSLNGFIREAEKYGFIIGFDAMRIPARHDNDILLLPLESLLFVTDIYDYPARAFNN